MPSSHLQRLGLISAAVLAAAAGVSLLFRNRPPARTGSPSPTTVQKILQLEAVSAAEARLLAHPEDPAARKALAAACEESHDACGAALALYPLVESGDDDAIREQFVGHCLTLGWREEARAAYEKIREPSPALVLSFARSDVRHGERVAAAARLKRLATRPLSSEDWLAGALIWLQARNPEAAVSWAKRAAEGTREPRATALVQARCLYSTGDLQRLLNFIGNSRLAPDDPLAAFWKERALLRSAHVGERDEGTQMAAAVAETLHDNPVAAFEAGRALVAARQPKPAIGYINQALQADYQAVLCYELLSQAYSQLGDRREALWAQGRAAMVRGRLPESVELFRQSLELDPTRMGAYLDLAKAYSANQHPQSALEVLDRAQKIKPKDLDLALLRASVLGRLERVAEQTRLLEEAASFDESRANEPLGELGKIYHESHQFDRAIETLERAVKLDKGDALAHLYLGLAYARGSEETGRATQAVDHLLQSAMAQPTYFYPWMNAGSTLRTLGRNQEAAACFRRAIDGDSRWEGPYLSLSQVLQQQGRGKERAFILKRYARARELETLRTKLENAVSTHPNDAQARFQLGERLLRDGQVRPAYGELIQAVSGRPGTRQARERFADTCALLDYEDLLQEAALEP